MEMINLSGFLAELTLKSALFLVAVAVLSRGLHRARPELRSRIWCAVFGVLALLPILSVMPNGWSVAVGLPSVGFSEPSILGGETSSAVPQVAPTDRQVSGESKLAGGVSPWTILWLLGALSALIRLGHAHLRARRLVRAAEPVTCGRRLRWLELEAQRIGLGPRAQLLQSAGTRTPVAFGFRRPGLLLPVESEQWSAERYRLVLRHELSHIRRRDLAAQLSAQLVCCLYWLNPLVWWAARQFSFERERACDERVLTLGADPATYAGHLLEIARDQSDLADLALATTPMVGRSGLEQRLKAILGFRPLPSSSPVARILPLMLVFGLGSVLGLLRPADAQDPVAELPLSITALGDETMEKTAVEETVVGERPVEEQGESSGSKDCGLGCLDEWVMRLPFGAFWFDGNAVVLRSDDLNPIQQEELRELVRSIQSTGYTPALRTVMRSMQHGSAEHIAERLSEQGLLSSQGRVQVDQRTNSIILREIPERVDDVLRAIDDMDMPPNEP